MGKTTNKMAKNIFFLKNSFFFDVIYTAFLFEVYLVFT